MDTIDGFTSIPQGFFAQAQAMPDAVMYEQADGAGGTTTHTYRDVAARVRRLAATLQELGVTKGSHVAIIAATRPEWVEADLASLTLGAVVVSVYQSLAAPDAGFILFDSGAEFVFAENQEQVDKVLTVVEAPFEVPETEHAPRQQAQVALKGIIAFEAVAAHRLVTQYADAVAAQSGDVSEAAVPPLAPLGREDIATLVYTSGTTGAPKGVVQTHGNHLANVRQAGEARIYREDSRLFLMLPLAHAFARLMSYIAVLTPAIVSFTSVADKKTSKVNPKQALADLRHARCDVIPMVPRFLEKMMEGVVERSRGGSVKARLLRLALWAAANRGSSISARLAFGLTGSVRARVKSELFGTNFKYCVSGGAKLAVPVCRFFDSLGIDILEGYGLTETCVATNVNRQGRKKIGTVGPVLAPDIEVSLAEDGEVSFRGPNISQGYWHRPQATQASFTPDGWFRTGDFGSLDSDGYLTIVGRKKELIVTSTGKNIPPEPIEERLKGSPYISQAVVIGDDRPHCGVLVTLDEVAVRQHFGAKKIGLSNPLAKDPEVRRLLDTEIKAINKTLASHECLKKFLIVEDEFTIENGLLTPTMKVKRKEVVRRFADAIESLY